MVDVTSRKRCAHHGCSTIANYGVKGGGTRKFCARHAEEGMVHISATRSQPSGDREGSEEGGGGSSRSRVGGAGSRASSDGGRTNRDSSVDPAQQPFSGRSKGTGKQARRTAASGPVRPVEVKREEPVDSVADHEESGSLSDPGAAAAASTAVKTEDMEVSCKVEPTEAEGGGGNPCK